MAYTTGKSKSLDDITLDDALKYPIWEWALDEEGEDGQDETWQRPIVDTDNVTDDIYNPTITIKIKDTELFGSAEYDNDTQKLTLQKSLPCSYASGTHSATLNTDFQFKLPRRRANT